MHFSARALSTLFFVLVAFCLLQTPAFAQTDTQSTPEVSQTTTLEKFRTPNTYSDVPQNHHTFTQIVLIDVLSAITCQLTGIDPTNPKLPCLGVDTSNGKIGMAPPSEGSETRLGGALGTMTNYIAALYVPAVSSTQYTQYLSNNFGIVKQAYAAPAGGTDCSNNQFGYGFCGLYFIFDLWVAIRDAAYAILTILFIVIGIGVMVRFKVDPRTVMTLQNQIPRIVVSIVLITFSYAIAGLMIDVMWTTTYIGINFIAKASPNSKIATSCEGNGVILPLAEGVPQQLLDHPLSFANQLFRSDCEGGVLSVGKGGIFSVADKVSKAFGGLITQVVQNVMGWNLNGDCGFFNFSLTDCIQSMFVWITNQIIKLIIIIALLMALFRLWFVLIKTYVTFLIFVILGPIWIVMGLVPGRPLGFEQLLRIWFANLAAFPLVVFILVFAKFLMDAGSTAATASITVAQGATDPNVLAAALNPQSIFIPPLVGNPNVTDFSTFMAFGAIMIAPTIPDMIKERLKAKGKAEYGKTIAAGLGFAAGAATSPGKKLWESANRKNPTTGAPEGAVAVMKQKYWQKTPGIGRRSIAKKKALHDIQYSQGGDMSDYKARKKWYGDKENKGRYKTPEERQAEADEAARRGNGGGNEPS